MAIAQGIILRRNTTFWLISIFIALLSMLVFGSLFKPESQAFDLSVVDEDGSEASRNLRDAFSGLENVKLREGGQEDELSALRDGDRGAGGIVPQGVGAGGAQRAAGVPGH